MARPIDAYKAIDIIDEWLDSVGTVMVGHGLSSYGELIGCIEDTPTITQPNEFVTDNYVGDKEKSCPANETLTIEVLRIPQLCQIVGRKVQVIRMGEMCRSESATVYALGDCKTDSGLLCYHELYGKTWVAFRQSPEGRSTPDGH